MNATTSNTLAKIYNLDAYRARRNNNQPQPPAPAAAKAVA